jgi:hypothetical protein
VCVCVLLRRDVALYALGVGACGADAIDEKELHLVYHRDGQPHIKVPPSVKHISFWCEFVLVLTL